MLADCVLFQLRTEPVWQDFVFVTASGLDSTHMPQGNDHAQKGGPVEVVNKRVTWPHEHILGGLSCQRVTYDQLSLTQFIQGFVKNIIDEQDRDCKDKMLHYLMEDATDFSWSSAKSAHAVLLCEMERGQ